MKTLTKGEIAARLNGQPALFAPAAQASILALPEAMADDEAFRLDAATDVGGGKPYRVEDGMAIVPVHGSLLHRVDSHYPGYFTGYNYITDLVDAAAADPSVKGIVLDVASHGGEVNGCFDCADVIHAASKVKPVYAVVDGYAHSAGYALASQADQLFMSETASVGSIGVITMHVDYSKMLEEAGIKVTTMFAGKHKADGSPFKPLSAAEKGRIEARLEKSYAVFVAKVDRGRGIGEDVIRDTEAGCYPGPEAVELGLADAVMSPREAFAAIKGGLSGSATSNLPKGVTTMSAANAGQEPVVDTAATEEAAAAVTPEAPAVAAAAPENVDTAAVAKAERDRVQAILGCEEAKSRGSFASHLAFNTDLTVEKAREMLAASAAEQAAKPAGNALDDAMRQSGGGAGVEADAPVTEPKTMSAAARILADQALVTGATVKH